MTRPVALQILVNLINPYLCLVFVNHHKTLNEVYQIILTKTKRVAILHGQLPLRVRLKILKDVKALKYKFVVCTDVASRGLDIAGTSHVISYQLPNNLEFYFHRAGRCGRMNSEGTSYVLYEPQEEKQLNILKRQHIKFEKLKLSTSH